MYKAGICSFSRFAYFSFLFAREKVGAEVRRLRNVNENAAEADGEQRETDDSLLLSRFQRKSHEI